MPLTRRVNALKKKEKNNSKKIRFLENKTREFYEKVGFIVKLYIPSSKNLFYFSMFPVKLCVYE